MNNLLFFITKKVSFFFVVFSFCFINIQAQQSKSEFWSHVRYGGNLSLSFGQNYFSGTIAPSSIYQFNKQFALGLGLNATFNNQKNIYKSTILGGSVIGLYNVIPALQFSAEFEQLNVDQNYESNIYPDQNYWAPALYLGLGYQSGNITFGVRFDVLYDNTNSVYLNPWSPFFRFYF